MKFPDGARPIHDDVINWKHFPRYWPLCGEFTGEFPTQRPVTRSSSVEQTMETPVIWDAIALIMASL